jgi:hypothetical protein
LLWALFLLWETEPVFIYVMVNIQKVKLKSGFTKLLKKM